MKTLHNIADPVPHPNAIALTDFVFEELETDEDGYHSGRLLDMWIEDGLTYGLWHPINSPNERYVINLANDYPEHSRYLQDDLTYIRSREEGSGFTLYEDSHILDSSRRGTSIRLLSSNQQELFE